MLRIIGFIIDVLLSIAEVLLGLRLIFKFLHVNAAAPFVAWVYGATAPLVAPFNGIMPNIKLSGFVIDSGTVAAIAVYTLIEYLMLDITFHSRDRLRHN